MAMQRMLLTALILAAGSCLSPLAAQTLPGRLTVAPAGGFASSGQAGGPFTPPSTTYTLSNTGTESIGWTSSHTENWVTVTPAGGTLSPSGSTVVTISIDADAATLTPGEYTDSVVFTSLGGTASRTITLTVSEGPPPTLIINPPPPTTTTVSPLVLHGTAAAGAHGFVVTKVLWNIVNEDYFWGGFASGTTLWECSIRLVPGNNDISITAQDNGGGKITQAFTVFYDPPPGADDGSGSSCGLLGVEGAAIVAGLWLLRRRRFRPSA
jgi:hypothetical protein